MAKGWSGSPRHMMTHGTSPAGAHTGARVGSGQPGPMAGKVSPKTTLIPGNATKAKGGRSQSGR